MSQEVEIIDERREALAKFQVKKEEILALCSEYSGLTVTGPDDKEGMVRVRAARMRLSQVRIEGEKTRKALNEKALRWNQTVNAAAHELFDPIDPVEAHLKYQENTAERERIRLAAEAAAQAERDRKAKLDARIDKLQRVGCAQIVVSNIEAMSDVQYDAELARVTREADEREARREQEALERAERESADALRRSQIEAAEREAKRIEADRLAKERAEFDRQRMEQDAKAAAERARLDAERLRLAEERRVQAAADEKARIARDAAEAERRAAEDAKRKAEHEAMARELEADRVRREGEARAAQAKLDAERAALDAERTRIEAEKSERARIEAEQRRAEDAKAEAARKAALAPDAEKVRAYLDAIGSVTIPMVFCSSEIEQIVKGAVDEIGALLP